MILVANFHLSIRLMTDQRKDDALATFTDLCNLLKGFFTIIKRMDLLDQRRDDAGIFLADVSGR